MWFVYQVLSVLCWAGINVLDSVLVQRYKLHPMVLMWNQSVFSMIILLVMWMLFPLQTTWWIPLFLVGIFGYVGDTVFFATLKRIDVSVANVAWILLSVTLAIGGFVLFGERLTLLQGMGVLLVLAGVSLLSFWQRTIGNWNALFLLPLLAILYTPFYLVQKAALLAGADVLAVFFWSLVGREMTSFVIGPLLPPMRARLISSFRTSDLSFYLISGFVILLFFAATDLTTLAFAAGPASLVGVVGNVQPFFVLLLAWIFCRAFPRFAPKELLDSGALKIKILSFLIAFAGLALLAVK